MPIGIGSNIASLKVQRRLSDSTSSISNTYERLASGQRINKASDDAAGLALSSALNSRAKVFDQAVRNANDGISLYSIADATVSSLTDINTRLQELAEQSANGVYSPRQRKAMDAEAQALSKEYFRITRAAQFNGQTLFDGSMSSGLRLQLGYGTTGSIQAMVGGKLGDGTVSVRSTFSAENGTTTDAAIGDINGDGVLDLVTVGTGLLGEGIISIRAGDGTGSFSTTASVSYSGYSWYGVALGDINGDGAQDIVAAGLGSGAGRTIVLLNSGSGTFQQLATYSSESTSSYSVTLGDLNNDGVLDLISAGKGTGAGSATVRLGSGNGTFGTAVSYQTEKNGSSPTSVAVALADLNQDGNLDLITAGKGNSVGIFTMRLGTGSGTFGTDVSFAADTGTSSALAIGDVNNDGILDVVTAGQNSALRGTTTVRFGTGGGSFSASSTGYLTEYSGSFGVQLADLNGDGYLDLLTSGSGTSSGLTLGHSLSIRLGTSSGAFGAINNLSTFTAGVTGAASQITTGDVNGDGVTDIIQSGAGYDYSTSYYTGEAAVLIGNTRDGISPMQPFSLQSKGEALQALGLFARTAKNLSDIRSGLGATQSRLGTALSGLASTRETLRAADSRIRDIDVAQESAKLISAQIRQRAGAAVLAQANLAPTLALRLLT